MRGYFEIGIYHHKTEMDGNQCKGCAEELSSLQPNSAVTGGASSSGSLLG